MQHDEVATKAIAASIGLAGFTVAVFSGIAAENPFDIVITRAVFALVIACVIGWFVGYVCTGVVNGAILAQAESAKAASRAAAERAEAQTQEAEEVGEQIRG